MEIRQITEEAITGKIDASFDNVEKMRGEGLERVKVIQSIKNRTLEKEHLRLSEKLGPDHPRVIKIAARIEYNRGMFKDLDVEIEKANINVPPVDKDSWMIHGRVCDKERKGISGLTIGLFDGNGKWVKELGYGCTDKQGYFSIIYTLKEGLKPETQESMNLFLYVSDKNYKILYKDNEPLSVSIGHVDYREICLSGEEICSTPEPGENAYVKMTRYLGNSSKRELHDLQNAKPRCLINKISPDHKVYFQTEEEAQAAGYDYCAYCFGKAKSKR